MFFIYSYAPEVIPVGVTQAIVGIEVRETSIRPVPQITKAEEGHEQIVRSPYVYYLLYLYY